MSESQSAARSAHGAHDAMPWIPVQRFVGVAGREAVARTRCDSDLTETAHGKDWALWSNAAPPVAVRFALVLGFPPTGAYAPDPFCREQPTTRALEIGSLSGSHAVCALDQGTGRIAISRSPAGARRIYVREEAGGVWFASELELLCEACSTTPKLDPARLFMFLEHLQIPAPITPYAEIDQLFPGESRWIDASRGAVEHARIAMRKNPLFLGRMPTGRRARGPEAVAALDRGLREAMKTSLAPGANGLLLSGGKDSAALLVACPEERRRDLHCLVVASPGSAGDESELAARLAADLGHGCDVLRPTTEQMLAAIEGSLARADFPVGDPTAAALAAIAPNVEGRFARILDGTGNDSVFGQVPARALVVLRRLRRIPFLRLLRERLGSRSRDRRLLRPRRRFFMSWDGLITGVDCPPLTLTDPLWERALGFATLSDVQLEKTDVQILVKEPSSTFWRTELFGARVAAEVEFPWLGTELTEAVLDLDESELWRPGLNKWALRCWLEREAPPYVSEKPKGYFAIPFGGVVEARRDRIAEWQREPERLALCDLGIPPEAIRGVLARWLAGSRVRERAVWGILQLEAWVRARA